MRTETVAGTVVEISCTSALVTAVKADYVLQRLSVQLGHAKVYHVDYSVNLTPVYSLTLVVGFLTALFDSNQSLSHGSNLVWIMRMSISRRKVHRDRQDTTLRTILTAVGAQAIKASLPSVQPLERFERSREKIRPHILIPRTGNALMLRYLLRR